MIIMAILQSHQIFRKKTMITCFFNGNGLQFMYIKPQGVKINASYFVERVLTKLEKLEVTKKAKTQKQMMSLSQNMNFLKNLKTFSKENQKIFISHFFMNGKGVYINALI